MNTAIYILIFAIVLVIVMILLAFIIKSKQKGKTEIVRYRKKYLLTKNEYSFFQKLKPAAEEKNLRILCKIRLADLIEPLPNQNRSEWFSDFNRIKAKHIDFALVTENMHVVLLIELEDSSHDKEDRMERDEFVVSTLKQVGYTIVCVYNNDTAIETILSALDEQ